MPLLTAVSTSQQAGEIAAVAALAVLLVALLNRIIKRRGQTSPSVVVARSDVAAAPAPAADGSSVAPPGWGAAPPTATAPAVAPAPQKTPRRAQVTDAVAAVIVLAMLVFGVAKIADSNGSTHPSVNGTRPASSAPASPAPASSSPGSPGSPAPLT